MARIICLFILLFLDSCSKKDQKEVTIITQPRDSQFWVDGKYQGYTPQKIRLKKGFHDIRIEKENYYLFEKKFKVGNEKKQLFDLSPIEKKVSFKFNVIPKVFYMDGVQQISSKEINYSMDKTKVDIFVYKEKYGIYRDKNFYIKDKNYIRLRKVNNGKIIIHVNKSSQLYIENFYIKDLKAQQNNVLFLEAGISSELYIKPKDTTYFSQKILTSVENRKVIVLKVDFLKKKTIKITSAKAATIKIISPKKGLLSTYSFIEGETKEINLYEKRYIFDISTIEYDTIRRVVDVSKLGDVITLDKLLNRKYNEKNGYREDRKRTEEEK